MLANHTAICQLFDRCVKQQLGLDWEVEVLRFECCTCFLYKIIMKVSNSPSNEGDHLSRWFQDLQMKRTSWVLKGTPWTKRRDSKVGLQNCIELPRYEKLRSRNAFLENYRQLISWPFHGKSHTNLSLGWISKLGSLWYQNFREIKWQLFQNSQILARQEPLFAESLDEFDHAKEVQFSGSKNAWFLGPLQDTCDFFWGALTKVVVSLSDEYKAAEGEDSKLWCWVEYVAFRCANMVCLMVSFKYILVLQDS